MRHPALIFLHSASVDGYRNIVTLVPTRLRARLRDTCTMWERQTGSFIAVMWPALLCTQRLQ
jgi:hypothetical protein